MEKQKKKLLDISTKVLKYFYNIKEEIINADDELEENLSFSEEENSNDDLSDNWWFSDLKNNSDELKEDNPNATEGFMIDYEPKLKKRRYIDIEDNIIKKLFFDEKEESNLNKKKF